MEIKRLEKMESKLGESLPADYRQYLLENEIVSQGENSIQWMNYVTDVRTIYGFDNGSSCLQLDETYYLVGDVLPTGAIPIAADWSDNFFLIFLSSFNRKGVYYWDHEGDSEDHSVKLVANSFQEFLDRLEIIEVS